LYLNYHDLDDDFFPIELVLGGQKYVFDNEQAKWIDLNTGKELSKQLTGKARQQKLSKQYHNLW